jgi:iron complex transport system ATP-binding protein
MVETADITYNAGGQVILHPTSLSFASGMFHVIMGANGAGKSTLMRLLAGDEHPSSGDILWDGKFIHDLGRRELALKRAVLSQHYHISFPHTVNEIVSMGRYPHFSGRPSRVDNDIISSCMKVMDVSHLADREYQTLSGGEAQKVQMARVLAQMEPLHGQEHKVLFLDEPVSHLDIRFQHQLLGIAKKLSEEKMTVIAILHDINLALAFADRILFMKKGRILHDIHPAGDVTPQMIQEIFDVPARMIYPDGHAPVAIF